MGLRTRLKNSQAAIRLLIPQIKDFGKTVVSGRAVKDMSSWLDEPRPKRHATVDPTQSSLENLSQTESSTECTQQTRISM